MFPPPPRCLKSEPPVYTPRLPPFGFSHLLIDLKEMVERDSLPRIARVPVDVAPCVEQSPVADLGAGLVQQAEVGEVVRFIR